MKVPKIHTRPEEKANAPAWAGKLKTPATLEVDKTVLRDIASAGGSLSSIQETMDMPHAKNILDTVSKKKKSKGGNRKK